MERVGAPLFPKFSVLAGTGKKTEAGLVRCVPWPVLPGDITRGWGRRSWVTGWNTWGTASLCSTEIAAGLEFSALPQNTTSASKKEQQHW